MNDEERNKKERKKMNKVDRGLIFQLKTKVSGTLRVVLHLGSNLLLVYRLFVLVLARLDGCAPIPYVQDVILNLRHPYIVITVATAITDTSKITP